MFSGSTELKTIVSSAGQTLQGYITRTELKKLEPLSKKLNNNIYIKCEHKQVTGSFKFRGAYNLLRNSQRTDKTYVTTSSGNHGIALSYAANLLGMRAIVIVPQSTPQKKIDKIKRLGAEVIVRGKDYSESKKHAIRLSKENEDILLVESLNDPFIIAGNSTVFSEVFSQVTFKTDFLFVPVGRGTLISGFAVHQRTKDIQLIACETDRTASLKLAMLHNKPIHLEDVGGIAGGLAVNKIGDLPYELLSTMNFSHQLVDDNEVVIAQSYLEEKEQEVVEPSGAVSLAAAIKYVHEHKIAGKNIICVASGGNA